MGITNVDMMAYSTLGVKVTSGTGDAPTAPNAPTITAVAGDDSITVTIDGDPDVANYVYYKASTASAWSNGGNRSGDGTVVISGLSAGTYQIVAYSSNSGVYSLPSNLLVKSVVDAASADTLWELALLDILFADATVYGLIANKVFCGYAPPTQTFPYIIYQQISGNRDYTLSGPTGLVPINIQLDIYATTYASVRAIAKAVRYALDGYDSTLTLSNGTTLKVLESHLTNESDIPGERGDNTVIYGKSLEFEIWIDERP